MSDADESQKTEEPTARRLSKAFEEGNVPKSQDLAMWVSLAAGVLIVLGGGPLMADRLSRGLIRFLESPHTIDFNAHGLQLLMGDVLILILSVVAIPFVLLIFAGIMGNLVQHKPTFSAKKLQPDISKLNPIQGAGRIFGVQGWVNLGKAIGKLGAVAVVVWLVVGPDLESILALLQLEPSAIFSTILVLAAKVLGGILAVTFVLAIADLVYQRYTHQKKLRMTRKEVADERKDMDGDPLIKNKIRQLRREKAMQRMIENVRNATVVVMNPTHYAVALKYVEGETPAPICVAKGVDAVALRIRDVAEESKVAVVENPPLARALHATVDLDEQVPEQHYKAVAEVIGYVYRLQAAKSRPPRRPN